MKISRKFKIVTAALLLLFLWIVFAPYLAEWLIIEKPLPQADVIFVLGGSSVYLERTRKAADEYKKGIAPTILLTDDGMRGGWSRTEKRNPKFVEFSANSLIAEGVSTENIEILTPAGSGTIYEAQALMEMARANSWKSILIVTSAYHTRRALWTFERELAGENVEFGIVAPATGDQTPVPQIWWLTPRGWSVVAGEYVKSFYYWVYY